MTRRRPTPRRAAPDANDTTRLLHELQVHQLELESQNAELRQTRDQLEALVARFTDLYDFAPAGYVTLDRLSVIRQLNLTLAGLLGGERATLVGRKLTSFLAVADREAFCAFLAQVMQDGARRSCEVNVTGAGPSPIVLRVEGSRSADGETCLAVVLDITDQTRAAEALHLHSAALSAAANPIIITDAAGAITWANPAFTALTGYSAGEVIGRNPGELLKSGVHDRPFYEEMWRTILAGRVWRGEVTNRRKDGVLFPEELTITPVRNARGEIVNFVAVIRDLTRDKAIQQQLLQAQKMESVGLLAGGVAHDFNNLLTVINGMVDLALAEVSPDSPLQADLSEVRRASERATTLTRQLLAFSRQQILRPEVLNLNDLITDLLRMLRRLIGEDIELVTRLANDLGPVRADAGQLEQVIMNLGINARDAMPGGGTLTVQTDDIELSASQPTEGGVELPPGRYVRLRVSDDGEGMDAGTLARAFEPFFTTKAAGKGTGLGLSTVYGIVTQSGGGIDVSSQPGRGTEFTILLPRADVPARAAPRRTAPAPAARASAGGTILVVDDEPALRAVAIRILSRHGYRVLEAGNGADALEVMERHGGAIDLLLTDVVMPGMSGPQLARSVQERYPATRCLFASGYTDDTMLRHGVDEHRVHFIGKPYSIQQLTAKVRDVLEEGR